MAYNVIIRKNSTGEVRSYRHDYSWDDSTEFMWSEGNYGCDCNRHSFFCEAAAQERTDWPCGVEEYAIPHIELDDGRRVEIDGDG